MPLQSQAAATTARVFSIAVRSVHVSLLHTADTVPGRSRSSPIMGRRFARANMLPR